MSRKQRQCLDCNYIDVNNNNNNNYDHRCSISAHRSKTYKFDMFILWNFCLFVCLLFSVGFFFCALFSRSVPFELFHIPFVGLYVHIKDRKYCINACTGAPVLTHMCTCLAKKRILNERMRTSKSKYEWAALHEIYSKVSNEMWKWVVSNRLCVIALGLASVRLSICIAIADIPIIIHTHNLAHNIQCYRLWYRFHSVSLSSSLQKNKTKHMRVNINAYNFFSSAQMEWFDKIISP